MPNTAYPESLLWVGPQGMELQPLEGFNSHRIEYSFLASCPQDGFAAWPVACSEAVEQVEVAAGCETFTGGFAQQALNRLFAQALLRIRPRAVIVSGLAGCTADLPRVAALMGVPSLLLLDRPVEATAGLGEGTCRWLRDALQRCRYVLNCDNAASHWPDGWVRADTLYPSEQLPMLVDGLRGDPPPDYRFDYSTYEFCQRDHPLLVNMQAGDVGHFGGCASVLDLGCGVGIFLDCLRREGIAGVGVERDPRIAEYGRGMGLDIITGDALEFLEQEQRQFDGIYCSHFVEHLPFEILQRLIDLLAERIAPGGVLVLVFPDPESIRSQLLGFWRDPEHVRFYHPELVASLGTVAGLELEWSSHQAQPHKVVPFPDQAPELPVSPPLPSLPAGRESAAAPGRFESLLQRLGWVPQRRLEALEQRLQDWSDALQHHDARHRQTLSGLAERTDLLWDVNRTWGWNDNATLRLRKRHDSP